MFIGTWGQQTPLKDYYIELETPDVYAARAYMAEYFARIWCGCYQPDQVDLKLFSKGSIGKVQL